MCNCRIDIENKIKKTGLTSVKKKIVSVSFIDFGLTRIGDKFGANSYSTVQLTLENQKKRVEVKIFHSYCPFCGKKVLEE